MLEVKQAETAGRIQYVLATEYSNTLQRLLRPGTHAFLGEDLTERFLMAQQFSQTGNAGRGGSLRFGPRCSVLDNPHAMVLGPEGRYFL